MIPTIETGRRVYKTIQINELRPDSSTHSRLTRNNSKLIYCTPKLVFVEMQLHLGWAGYAAL